MTRIPTCLHLLVVVAFASASVACSPGKDPDRRRVGVDAFIDTSNGASAACGTLTIGAIAGDAGDPLADVTDAPLFRATYVVDETYDGMEDNDLRGYLDGAFKEGWNQVSQSHLRLGRRGRNPAYGEFELFRNLHRWSDLRLPHNLRVENAELELALESGPPYPVDVAVYAVRKDWNPGEGGIRKDNNSPPAPGEVWWVDARSGELPWQRAGVGFASDSDPDADTSAQPLAVTRYTPDAQTTLTFSSERLARYVEERQKAALPLLLLYKLTDPYEDSIGSVMEIWSANFGTDGSARRPRLHIDWRPTGAVRTNYYDIALEPGRLLHLGRINTDGAMALASSFQPGPAQAPCGGEYRVEYSVDGASWAPLSRVQKIDAPSVAIRMAAVARPVALGSTSVAQLSDTWVPNGQPEDYRVAWTFESPDGRTITQNAEYIGEFTWQATLPADIIGRWTYRWTHELAGKPVTSETVVYDVVAWEPDIVMRGLSSLAESIRESGAQPRSHDMTRYELAFMRLERAAMALPPPDTASISTEMKSKLVDLRELLSGKPVPEVYEAAPIKSRDKQKTEVLQ